MSKPGNVTFVKGWGDTNGLPAVLLFNKHNEHSLTKYWSGRLGLMLAYYSVKCLDSIIMLSSDKNDWSFKKLESSKLLSLTSMNSEQNRSAHVL